MTAGPTFIVTGGAGFVGSNLAAALAARNPAARLTLIDDFRSGSFQNIVDAFVRAGAGPFTGRLIPDPAAAIDWPRFLERTAPDAVFHEAAITDTTVSDQAAVVRDNAADGFEPLLNACIDAGIPLVYASSAATYGTPPQAARREPFPLDAAGQPNNVYGFSKWLMEAAHRRAEADQLARGRQRPRVVGLRYFNVFGPGEGSKGHMASMVYKLARQMLDGRRPRIFSDGRQARDQVYIDDVVACTLAGGEREAQPGVYNVGSGRATTFNQIIDAIRDALGVDAPTEFFDMPADIRAFYQDYTCADLTETERGLGWKPAHDPLDAARRYARDLARD